MVSRIRIKIGNTEIEFEGSEDYMRDELPKLVELLGDIAPLQEEEVSEVLQAPIDPDKQKLQMTTNTIASKLNVSSGSDLALAACAHLCLVKGAGTYTRANILGEMKLATNYYKQTYNNNLSKSLKSLVKAGKILETSQDTYAMDAKEKKMIEAKLNAT